MTSPFNHRIHARAAAALRDGQHLLGPILTGGGE
jgi:hypothetical protein